MMLRALTALTLTTATPLFAQAAPGIDSASWLAGRWVGAGLGGQIEESWAPPVDGRMIGHFQLVRNGKPQFYELLMLDQVPGGLRLRVKHFNPDFTAWEDKEGWHSFEPVAVAPDELRFKGITFRRQGDELIINVTLRAADGTVAEHPIRLRRTPL